MKVTLESTSKLTTLVVNGQLVPARVWEGATESGVRCHALITCIAVKDTDDNSEFQRELEEHRPPSAEADRAFPLRMIL